MVFHSRPPTPVEEEKSKSKLSQGLTIEGAEIITEGINGNKGGDIEMLRGKRYGQVEEEHSALIFLPMRETMSPGRTFKGAVGMTFTAVEEIHEHIANEDPLNLKN